MSTPSHSALPDGGCGTQPKSQPPSKPDAGDSDADSLSEYCDDAKGCYVILQTEPLERGLARRSERDGAVASDASSDWHSLCVDARAGAVSSFVGTTRNSFMGKTVVRLEYEAYEALALKEMRALRRRVFAQWSGVYRVLVWHRLGEVPVGEASVVIAVASEHRAEGLAAVAWAIDELKRRVPVWKKEVYADGSAWKGNCEFCPRSLVAAQGTGAGQGQGQEEQGTAAAAAGSGG